MNTKILKAFALLVTIPMMASAAPVSRYQAQEMALQFMNVKGMKSEAVEMAFRSPRRGQTAEETAYYYVFNAADNGGFVIVSGDDRTAEVLGYAYEGTFDEAALPAHIKSFLQTYADEIQYLDDANITESQRAPHREARQDYEKIQPLMKSRWDQGAPYNNLCPSGCPTGCAATSTAQVMYHHKWPAMTTATIPSYRTSSNRFNLLSIPDSTVINWDDMCDTYSYGASSASRQAVAELMKYVGQAIKMDYDFMGSGAYSSDMGPALNNYFDYQVTQLYRENFPLLAFEDSIYQQLANDCPVIFNGMSTGGGHSFVVDGYDGDHYFHVNWGWGGQSDANFLLSVLNPYNNSSYGASSSSDGFSFGQDVLFLKPKMEKPGDYPKFQMSIVGVTDKAVLLSYYSLLSGSKEFEFGLGSLQADGSVTPLDKSIKTERIQEFWGEEGEEFLVSGLSEGTHRLVPIYRLKGDSTWNTNSYPYAEVIVNDDSTFEFNTVWNKMETTGYEFSGSLFVNQEQPFKVTFRNATDQEYYGPIYMFSNRGKELTASQYSSYEGYTVQAHDSLQVSYKFRPTSGGSWTISFTSDMYGKCILGSCTVSINSGDLEVDGLRFKLDSKKGEAKLVSGGEEYVGDIIIPDTVVSANQNFPVTAIDKNAFVDCAGLTNIVLPGTLLGIGDHCFEGCSGLVSIHIPQLVNAIGTGAFAGCNNLANFTVDENNTKYSASEGMLFSNNGKVLNSYPSAKGIVDNLPDTLTTLGDGCFNGTAITRIILPESIKTLGMSCFADCDQLASVISLPRSVPACYTGTSTNAFAGLDFDVLQVVVPAGTETAYANTGGWKKFSHFDIFKVYGDRDICGFSAVSDVNLDNVVVVDGSFEPVGGASAKAYMVVSDSISGHLCALPVEGAIEAGNGLLVEGESILVFQTSADSAYADMHDNLLVPALVDTDLSTISGAYTYSNGEFVVNSTDIVEAGGAYLVLENAEDTALKVYFDEIPGAISTIVNDAAPSVLYDLQGRRIAVPQSGLYVRGGKKVLFR